MSFRLTAARFCRSICLALASQFWSLSALAHAPAQATGIFAGVARDGVPLEWIRTNRGVILKNGAGEPLRLLCNDAYEAMLSETPPVIASPNGLIIASYLGGMLRISSDGCSADAIDAPLGDRHVADLATTAEPLHYLALLSPSPTQPGGLLVSDDAGLSWSAGAETSAFGTALLSAASDPARVYISAVAETSDGSPSNQLLVSSDGGASLSAHPFELAESEVRAFVVGVDPLDADRVFLRTLAGNPEQPERLLLSEDAGRTFSEVYSAVGPLVFAIDSKSAWLGGKAGLYRSNDRGKSFQMLSAAPDYIACLRPGADGLLVCGHQDNEFGIFRADAEQTHYLPYLRFGDVTHQVACDERVLGVCQANFDDWLSEVGPEAEGGAGGSAGASNAGAASSSPHQGSSGCSFRAPSSQSCLPLALVVGLSYSWRRRLRNRKRRTHPVARRFSTPD